ncbi:DUF885 domain-containing protein [Saccharobesus litoralis]|uniref:DUF885 domain-containing protein n=1 Tax=Saccharobesus litoralis TaxID=2172099 RepID=A0A2S0VU64_9ALTE|nr:DUF885 domain-containing protein [Saccharobesus litoralis]AWB67764.1 DUF885 domain-containing protein [Saccharobesus litoralis]
MNNSFKHICLASFTIIGLLACNDHSTTEKNTLPQPKTPVQTTNAIDTTHKADTQAIQLFDEIFEAQLARSPMYLTYLGRKTDQDKWDDLSDAYQLDTHKLNQSLLAKLQRIEKQALSPSVQLSYTLLENQLQNDIDDYQWRLHSYPVNQMWGTHTQVPSMLINQHKIDTIDDAKAYISRINKVSHLFDQLIIGLDKRAEAGIIVPKFVFKHVIATNENIASGSPISEGKPNPVWLDFTTKLDKLFAGQDASSHVQKQTLLAQAEIALKESFAPAYKKLNTYLSKLENQADDKDGVWKLPNGDAFYRNALARTTTTNLTAEQIHNIGLAEVKRIHEEMRQIQHQVEFNGTLAEFMQFVKTNKSFFYANTPAGKSQYLAEATQLIDDMKLKLPELFSTLPKADIIVKAVEEYREQSAGKAFYQRPSEDGKRPGTYYANLYDMQAMPTYQMAALAYHEGLPGHHMQIAIAQELKDVPKFRRFGFYTAYTEGWGLYSEYIPKEIGFYQDPYSDFGRLAMELWRACRLVVDTGIHAKKWTRQQGIDYYLANTPNAESDAIKMVERHIVMPSQATAYKIGMMKILELRESAKAKLGQKFDIRAFHDVVLKNGAIPLDELEKQVDNWVLKTL